VKKYFLFAAAFISSLFFLLQIPFTFQEAAFAKTITVQCQCQHEGVTGEGSNHGKNNWVCPSNTLGNGSCSHAEEFCQNTPGAQIGQTTTGGGRGVPSNTIDFVGVSCQTVSICGCSSDGKQIQCYSPVNGQPTHYIAGDQKSQAEPFNCNTGTSCTKKPGVNDTNLLYLNRPVSGVACVSQCTCDGIKNATPGDGKHGSAGQGKNGWTCKDGSKGACNNLEDYCSDTPSGTSSVSCINSSVCGCSSDKTQVVCHAGAGVKNQQGQPDQQSFDCGSGRQCVTGQQYSHDFANQQVKGADCQPINPPTLPPPPSPPCMQWSPNGRCDTFNSTFGGFSTDPEGFIQKVFAVLLSVSGGIALLLIMRSGYSLMTAQGNPEKINNAREQLVAAIVGLIFLIFSFVFLELIGYDILHIPGFQGVNATSPGGGNCLPGSCIPLSFCTAKNPGRCNSNGCPAGQACVQ
jgi:hypothetical protein